MATADLDTDTPDTLLPAAPGPAAPAGPDTGTLAELTNVVARFTALISRRLPDDVTARLKELADEETNPMATMIYQTMERN